MKSRILLLIILCFLYIQNQAQTKFGDNKATINGSSLVELESTNKALLFPRISLTSTSTWGLATATPVNGMVLYNINAAITGTTAAPALTGGIGMYYWDGAKWVGMRGMQKAEADTTYWGLHGNAGTIAVTNTGFAIGDSNYLGTRDNTPLVIGTNGIARVIIDANSNLAGGKDSYDAGNGGSMSLVWGYKLKDSGYANLLTGFTNSTSEIAYYNLIGGTFNIITGSNLIAGGYNNRSNSSYGLLSGYENIVEDENTGNAIFGNNNHISGTSVKGADSTIFDANLVSGRFNKSTGGTSSISGTQNNNTSYNSIIGGYQNSNTGANSSALFGSNNTADNTMHNSTVVGNYNKIVDQALFVVGAGSSSTPANAFVVTNKLVGPTGVEGLSILIPSLPTYPDEAAGLGDVNLPSGSLFRVSTDHVVHIK